MKITLVKSLIGVLPKHKATAESLGLKRPGDTIEVAIDTSRIHIFDKDTEKCICH